MRWQRWFELASVIALVAACGSKATQQAAVAPPPAPPPPPPPRVAAPALPVEPATTPHAPAGVNPFEGASFYVDPEYVKKVKATAKAVPAQASLLKKLEGYPTGLWLDSIEHLAQLPIWLDGAQKQSTKGKPAVPVFLVYDLPNRDCSAKSSAGELAIESGGEQRYRTEFIDKIAAEFAARPEQRVVVILEPDSLPNIATNLSVPKCAVSEDVYRASVAYAVAKLSLPNVFIYLDAAHAGWLGWDGNRAAMAKIYKEVLAMAGGADRISGFATNVSNYNVLSGDDGKKLEPSNPCPDELTYVQKLAGDLAAVGITNKGFIIDTARNGKGGIRTRWGNWCNIKGAGLGERPKVAPAPLVHAYYWVKPPGDSDGVADPSAARYDENCSSPDAAPGAPQAGQWFQPYFLELAKNANPPL
jgi:cellulose 1,4-beta-cellobiosidase